MQTLLRAENMSSPWNIDRVNKFLKDEGNAWVRRAKIIVVTKARIFVSFMLLFQVEIINLLYTY